MMLGETHLPNPTVHIPPWPDLDEDQTDLVYSPINYNTPDNNFNSNGSPFYLQEAFSALQRYLPSNEPDVELDFEFPGLDTPDSPVDAYSCDHFRIFEFKVRRCARGRSHDWTECPYAHPGEKARRRDPRKFHYSGTACPDFRKGSCRKGDSCEFAHGVFECWLHPARYRTQPCKDGSDCRRRVCFFAHTPDQLRVVTSSSADSHDGSSPSCAKSLTFWSSPHSGSPPVSPRAESSPPVSPMAQSLSRSLGSASINEMVTSLRNLQLGKVKSFQVGCSSPRVAALRSGFCSLPSTPTRNLNRPGTGYLDSWDKVCEEEPVMERVESGRDLRAKMFEKLSKENSLERVNPGQSSGAPDLDWVTDLTLHMPGHHKSCVPGGRDQSEVLLLPWRKIERRNLAEGNEGDNSSLILAGKRTYRRDPLNDFKKYTGGWNISNKHYWASVGFTTAPFFVVAAVWFVLFALCLLIICIRHCCCQLNSYGYSRIAYAISLICLILFTIAAIVGCVVLYTGQGKFHASTTDTLDYAVSKADLTAENLRNVSDYLSAAQKISVDAAILPADVQRSIDDIEKKINSSASTLSRHTADNKEKIQRGLDRMRLALIILAAVMLLLAFLGFLFSILGLQCLVYTLVIVGWILVAGTFVLCGVFHLVHNVAGDACVAMDQWVQNPTAHTALDDILPCVDNATAQETLLRTKNVTHQLVNIVNGVITNVFNRNFPPQLTPLYFNQSGPLLPALCNPFYSNLTSRQCAVGEVSLQNSSEVWRNYICQTSSSGICSTPGRLTPQFYTQMSAAVNVSYGLYRYGPFLVNLQDCTFVRDAFTDISDEHCPGLRHYSQWIYIGLVMVSAAVMLSLVFWVIYARERRHRVYTKQHDAATSQGQYKGR